MTPGVSRSSQLHFIPGRSASAALADRVAEAKTVLELLERAAAEHGNATLDFGAAGVLTFAQLLRAARRCAHALAERGPREAVVALALPTSPALLPVFYGAMFAGMTPTILPSPGLASREEFAERVQQVVRDAGVRVLVTQAGWRNRVQAALSGGREAPLVLQPEDLLAGDSELRVERSPDDIAFLQYSSGSTARPKGIALSHCNVVAGLAAILDGGDNQPSDIALLWLPLYHDMGLIGLLAGIACGISHHLTDPVAPFRDPGGWMRLMSKHRITYFGGPCSALGYLADLVDDATVAELDLSALRIICTGSEPIDPHVVQRFERRFAPAGLKPNLVCPAYGMAEATLGIASHRLGAPMRIDWVDRELLGRRRRVQRVSADDPGARPIVSLGPTLRGIELRVVSEDGTTLSEDREGEVQIRGRAVMKNYLNRAPSESHDGSWFRTGDLGYVSNGEIYLTGRIKHIVIVNGVNYHAEDCEWALNGVPQIFRGRCAAIDAGSGDRLTVVVETRADQVAQRLELVEDVRNRIRARLGLSRVRVALALPRTIPYTTSGKPRRVVLRELLAHGPLRPNAVEYFEMRG